ncbi:hypothetical protein C0J45_1299 [Silurus meridionalis]|nr:hypothetical protein C0J45_1299 [Silurus meridionalis]
MEGMGGRGEEEVFGWGLNCEGSSLELEAAQRVTEWSFASGPPKILNPLETQGSNNETKDGVFATNTIVPPEEDMKTFMNDKETSPPPDSKEEGALPEADQQVKESPAETQTSEAPAEKPAEPNIVDETDGDPAASTKTSVETLNDVLNENNNNNNAERSVHALFFEIGLND